MARQIFATRIQKGAFIGHYGMYGYHFATPEIYIFVNILFYGFEFNQNSRDFRVLWPYKVTLKTEARNIGYFPIK